MNKMKPIQIEMNRLRIFCEKRQLCVRWRDLNWNLSVVICQYKRKPSPAGNYFALLRVKLASKL